MRAFTYTKAHPLEQFQITETTQPDPQLNSGDVLVKIHAFSLNPVDTKIRQKRAGTDTAPVILGWDAAGVIEQTGSEVTGFTVGDEVYYAGALNRQGSNATLQAVDHRLIAKKPATLSFSQAAALPLTALTAQEALFERGFQYNDSTRVLVIGGAGGVGSMAIQLLKATTNATVIATASREDSIAWTHKMGADHVIGRDIEAGLKQLGIDSVDIIFSTTHTHDYLEAIPKVLRPFGHLVLIDDPDHLDIRHFKGKALSVHWEFMFAKSSYNYQPETQGRFLTSLSQLVDQKKIQSTLRLALKASTETLHQAHTLQESNAQIGKIVLAW